MEYMQRVLDPGAHASGVDVSVQPSGWRKRPSVIALNEFPTDGTGVSAGGCRT